MKPSAEQREQFVDELLEKERSIDAERDKMKRATKVSRGRIDVLERRRNELLDLIEGREHVQPELPMGAGKKGASRLKWRAEGKNQVADAAGGRYCLDPNDLGGVTVLFTATGRPSKQIGQASDEASGKQVALRHVLEQGADAILENAGDGKLTPKGRRKIAAQGGAVSRG